MNYFGHAAVASWSTASGELGGVALGAMLPDFAVMCGARVAGAAEPAIARGVALHHATDAVFHLAPAVLALFREAEGHLTARRVRRGPTRAAAHVGVELLLDAALLDEARHRDAYAAALEVDPGPVHWRDDGDADRFAVLHGRLRAHGVPDDLRRPRAAAERLFRMLTGRRLLAPDAAERVAIVEVLTAMSPRVATATPTVVRQVEAGLGARAALAADPADAG